MCFSKNSNPYFFREFIRELSRDLKQKPKQSLSGSDKNKTKVTGGVLSLLSKMSGVRGSFIMTIDYITILFSWLQITKQQLLQQPQQQQHHWTMCQLSHKIKLQPVTQTPLLMRYWSNIYCLCFIKLIAPDPLNN